MNESVKHDAATTGPNAAACIRVYVARVHTSVYVFTCLVTFSLDSPCMCLLQYLPLDLLRWASGPDRSTLHKLQDKPEKNALPGRL